MAEFKASPAAIDLIKQFEGLRLDAYRDPVGIWTIGWGHTEGVHADQSINLERAVGLLQADVAKVAGDLSKVVRVPLTQGQCDALISLCFNLGVLGLPRVAPKLVVKLNSGDYAGAAQELLDIDRAHGQVLAGLAKRRRAERELFLS